MGILEVQQKHMTDQFKPHFEKINKRIVGQISRMTNLMDQVLILGKINEDIVKPILEPTDLVELCKSISKTYDKIQLDGREIKLAVNGRPETIMLDTKLMQEALSNLISNALKYSINKPSPLVTIKFNKNDVQISIKDEGMGIPEGDLIHIFEPFYRASNVADLSGTGLGTVITKEYIELNGGTITVKSELNKGSEFIIKFKI
jgi:signal transduction histidine kinase